MFSNFFKLNRDNEMNKIIRILIWLENVFITSEG